MPARVRGSKTAFAVLASLALSAWTLKPAHLEIKSIGIIAAVGDTCVFEHVTDRPFQWIGPPEAGFLEISDWGIDDEVTKTVAAALGPAYRTQSIAIEHQDFDAWTYNSLVLGIHELPLPEVPVDAYLLILRDWYGDAIGGSNHQLGGLGLYRRDLKGRGARYGVFAAYRLVLMEPNAGAILASRAARLPNGELPWLPAPPALWPRTQNDLSDAQRRTLRTDFLNLIGAALPGTLRQIGLAAK